MLTRRTAGRENDPFLACLSEILGNVTFLERPFHPATFISVARTALKGRTRQFEARARIEELHESEERLRTALAAGRLGSWELDLGTWEITASAALQGSLRAKAGRAFDLCRCDRERSSRRPRAYGDGAADHHR